MSWNFTFIVISICSPFLRFKFFLQLFNKEFSRNRTSCNLKMTHIYQSSICLTCFSRSSSFCWSILPLPLQTSSSCLVKTTKRMQTVWTHLSQGTFCNTQTNWKTSTSTMFLVGLTVSIVTKVSWKVLMDFVWRVALPLEKVPYPTCFVSLECLLLTLMPWQGGLWSLAEKLGKPSGNQRKIIMLEKYDIF